jgi:hypothetical protein
MNIENTILTKDGLKTISSIQKNESIKFFFDSDLFNYDYWEMSGNLQVLSNTIYKINDIDFFERDVIRAKTNDGNPYDCWVFKLFEKFQNGDKVYFLSFDNTETQILTFEQIKIENINNQPKHIHFYFEDDGYVSYSEKNILVRANSYYYEN